VKRLNFKSNWNSWDILSF